ncbi:hypothetical protein CAL14_05450 [Bordetella genomosp. 9]|uniref:hypothetical protein n=1 Tax=Bordetella genomosp. 9 TaxID=1416803 RepID=UPI000A2977E3|nr:hypothetical protein [Bordetella genomosp. 9]ARP89800.1 hypothetical protein CAL14_05450 [Bordetella genomosp. 9]
MNSAPFDAWLDGQLAKGLVDIKFAISPGKDVSSVAVQDELLLAESAIDAGLLREAPQPSSMIPENILAIIREVALH